MDSLHDIYISIVWENKRLQIIVVDATLADAGMLPHPMISVGLFPNLCKDHETATRT